MEHSTRLTIPSRVYPHRSDEIGGEIEVAPAGPVQPHTAATLLRVPCSLAGAASTEVCGTTIAPRLPRNVALKDTLTHTTVRRHLCRAPKSAATEAAGCQSVVRWPWVTSALRQGAAWRATRPGRLPSIIDKIYCQCDYFALRRAEPGRGFGAPKLNPHPFS